MVYYKIKKKYRDDSVSWSDSITVATEFDLIDNTLNDVIVDSSIIENDDWTDEDNNLKVTIHNSDNAIDREIRVNVLFYNDEDMVYDISTFYVGSYDYILDPDQEIEHTLNQDEYPHDFSDYKIFVNFK